MKQETFSRKRSIQAYMIWYYVSEGKRIGPVDDAEFEAAVEIRIITPDTLVWNETLPQWKRYAEITPGQAPDTGQAQNDTVSQDTAPSSQIHFQTTSTKTYAERCTECGRSFERNDMIQLRGAWVCAACKPIVVQRLKEGVSLTTEMEYGGFWIRFLAKFIDGIILLVMQVVLRLLLTFLFFAQNPLGSALWFSFIFMNLFNLAIRVGYTTFFLGKYGATPGKMACGLRVVTSDGDPISYARACGRYFAEILSSIILLIGYIMAAFDEEKRTLHDRICDTRVIRK